ncbi:O-antigen ligase family protein [Lysobacter sp. Root494]|uniref:O-antigen ligase family protein n=1 Tax=Lysobacter sp. Root494 TaxID=1736549 RepID=UPI0006F44498|nr:O-antigen ligase family protein [Lysobacter sp. Root494]KQY52667.1 O-antigen polymerase [Lysobacter sp. Root494]
MFVFTILYLLLVLIRPQDYPELQPEDMLPWQQLALLGAGLFWLASSRKNLSTPQHMLLLGFVPILMLSSIANGWMGGALVQLEKFGPVVLAFCVLSAALTSPQRVRLVMATFAICAAVLSLHGIEQAELGKGWTGVELSQGTRIQYVGIFNDPNDLGMLFVMCVPMAVYMAYSGRSGLSRRIFWFTAAGVLVYGIYLTDSRGTLLALLAALGGYVWLRRGIVPATVLGVVALAGLMMLPSRMQELDASEASAAGRVDAWYEGLHMFSANPIFGIGPDNFADNNANLTAHNSFVLVLAETGIIGFTIWLAFVGYCFRMMYVVVRQRARVPGALPEAQPDPAVERQWHDDRAATTALLLSLIAFFVAAFFLSRSYVIILYLLAALVVGHYQELRKRWPSLPVFRLGRDLWLWPTIAVVAVVCLYVMVKVLLVTSA